VAEPTLTDSHAHVFWRDFDADRAETFARAREAGVERMVLVGTNLETSRAAFELAAAETGVYPTAGIHPHDTAEAAPGDFGAVAELCRRAECVGVGETGLDFFRSYSPRADQQRSFHAHLELAAELDKPVIVHCRDAHDATLGVLREHRGVRGVMHCFTMGAAELPGYLDLGFYVSFSGVVTFPRNDANREAARAVPADRLLVETDCPFLAPQGRRGGRNEPAFVRLVAECLAAERGVPLEELARQTHENAGRLFGLA